MPSKEPSFVERLQTAAKAKNAQLEKIRATVPATGAQSTERHGAQVEAAGARKIRTAQRRDADRRGAQQREAQRAAENARQALAVAEERGRKDAERSFSKRSEGCARRKIRRA